jgi:hypothetical protein
MLNKQAKIKSVSFCHSKFGIDCPYLLHFISSRLRPSKKGPPPKEGRKRRGANETTAVKTRPENH